jgi:D-alanyl-D-alanine carboxypeptidase/D-alanyl-D-alanine-endopeptidase (penicillin-binding protein 4)
MHPPRPPERRRAVVRRRVGAVAVLALVAALLPSTTGAASATTEPPSSPTAAARTRPALVGSAAQRRIVSLIPARVARAKALGRYRTGLVTDPVTGAVLWSSGATTPMRGASTTKLATAVTALTLLGTTTRFPTRVVTGRSPNEVVLVGGGDPMLTSPQLRGLARDTARALLAVVPPAPTTPAATAAVLRIAVTIDDTLYPAPTFAAGWPADYEPYTVRPVRPLVRDGRSGWDVAADAGRYFAEQVGVALSALLADRPDLAPHVVLTGRLKASADATELARFAGNTSAQALARMLLVSDNDIAEMLFRDDAVAAGAGGSWAAASRVETHTLRALGADVRGWHLVDGSGVSRNDRVSARGLVDLLTLARSPRHPEMGPLRGWLPVAGVSGTLAARDGRFTTYPTRCARGKVFAKTGTLFDTIGLAGYALGSDGRLRTFAVLVRSVDPHVSKLDVRHAVEVVPATATGCY